MKTIEIYKFEELNKDTQSKIIEREREKTEIYLDFFNDDCIEIIKENGYNPILNGHVEDWKIYFMRSKTSKE